MKVAEGRAEIDDVNAFLDRLGALGEEFDCSIQAFDARYVAGREHVESAVARADRAFERGENVARDRAVEILLYAAGRRQIDQALEMGVGEGDQRVVVVAHGGDESAAQEAVADLLAPADTLGPEHADADVLRSFFGITDAELDATSAELSDLVRERVALLDVEK